MSDLQALGGVGEQLVVGPPEHRVEQPNARVRSLQDAPSLRFKLARSGFRADPFRPRGRLDRYHRHVVKSHLLSNRLMPDGACQPSRAVVAHRSQTVCYSDAHLRSPTTRCGGAQRTVTPARPLPQCCTLPLPSGETRTATARPRDPRPLVRRAGRLRRTPDLRFRGRIVIRGRAQDLTDSRSMSRTTLDVRERECR